MSKYLITVTNAVLLNGGDAAIFYGIKEIISRTNFSHANVVIRASQPELTQRCFPSEKIRPLLSDVTYLWLPRRGRKLTRRLAFAVALILSDIYVRVTHQKIKACIEYAIPTIREYFESDFIISTGGTYLVPHYDIRHRLFEFAVINRLRKPFVLFAQSVGDLSTHPLGRLLARELSQASLIMLRDERSKSNVERLFALTGSQVPTVRIADAAFALPSPPVAPRRSRDASTRAPLRVAISVREWSHFRGQAEADTFERYKIAVAVTASWLVKEKRARITFISTCQGLYEYKRDELVAKSIVSNLHERVLRSIEVREDYRSVEEMRAEIADFDFCIATRMHMAILAIGVGTPVVPIAYEDKQNDLFEDTPFSDLLVNYETVSFEHLAESCDQICSALTDWRQRAEEMSARARADACTAVEHLENALR